MKTLRTCVALCLVVLFCSGVGAYASGEWYWQITPNPGTGTLHFTCISGSSAPLTLAGRVVNTDHANQLVFDGITLKTDELTPGSPALFSGLWTTNPAVEIPEAFTVDSASAHDFALGQFNAASAAPGIYQFKLTAAVEYDSVAANPDQTDSGLVTVEVLPVPEPASACGLSSLLAALALAGCRLRRRGTRHGLHQRPGQTPRA